jgi:carbon starvation protein
MNGTLILTSSLIFFMGLYFIYGRYLTRAFKIDVNRQTPAHTNFDGVDYVPTHPAILFGHHFSSIAGAGPIVGPIMAAHFGWLPALLWILIGCVFVGAVHDFAALFLSVRNGGKSIGKIIENLMGYFGRQLFLIFCWACLILVVAIFSLLVADSFIQHPAVASASIIFIFIALVFGIVTKKILSLKAASCIFVPLVFLTVWFSTYIPLDVQTLFDLTKQQAMLFWLVVIGIYIFVASVAPVQYLLQPRDYLSSYLLYAMIILGIVGIIAFNPHVEMDAFKGFTILENGRESNLFPTLFVVIACGACSGFHSLVASGTTSKQISNEKDILAIGYGSMIVEGILGVMSLITVIYLSNADFATLSSNPAAAFANGIGEFISILHLPKEIGVVFISLSISAFMLTSLDTATRLGRFCWQEIFGSRDKKVVEHSEVTGLNTIKQQSGLVKFVTNSFVASLIVVGISLIMAQSGSASSVWPIFGASNQLLAALTLLAITLYLKTKNLNYHITFLPTILMVVMSIWGLIEVVKQFWSSNFVLVGSAIFLISMASLLVILSLIVLKKHFDEIK